MSIKIKSKQENNSKVTLILQYKRQGTHNKVESVLSQ